MTTTLTPTPATSARDELTAALEEVFERWTDAVHDRIAARAEPYAERIYHRREADALWNTITDLIGEEDDDEGDLETVEDELTSALSAVEAALSKVRRARR